MRRTRIMSCSELKDHSGKHQKDSTCVLSNNLHYFGRYLLPCWRAPMSHDPQWSYLHVASEALLHPFFKSNRYTCESTKAHTSWNCFRRLEKHSLEILLRFTHLGPSEPCNILWHKPMMNLKTTLYTARHLKNSLLGYGPPTSVKPQVTRYTALYCRAIPPITPNFKQLCSKLCPGKISTSDISG